MADPKSTKLSSKTAVWADSLHVADLLNASAGVTPSDELRGLVNFPSRGTDLPHITL
jgi:hypothetical protein